MGRGEGTHLVPGGRGVPRRVGPRHPVRPSDTHSSTSAPSLTLTQRRSQVCVDPEVGLICIFHACMFHVDYIWCGTHACCFITLSSSFSPIVVQLFLGGYDVAVCTCSQVLSMRAADCDSGKPDGAQCTSRQSAGTRSALLSQEVPASRRQGSKRLGALQRHVNFFSFRSKAH